MTRFTELSPLFTGYPQGKTCYAFGSFQKIVCQWDVSISISEC